MQFYDYDTRAGADWFHEVWRRMAEAEGDAELVDAVDAEK